MCRDVAHGGRRCPYHSNPHVIALANARTCANRMAKRLEARENDLSEEQYQKRFERLMHSYENLATQMQSATGIKGTPSEAEGVQQQPLGPAAPTVAETITPELVDSLSWDELADLAGELGDDPEAAEKMELLISQREQRELKAMEYEDYSTGHEVEIDNEPVVNLSARPARKLTAHERAREEYDYYVYAQYKKCTDELSFMVNEEGARKGIDDFSLFSGPVSRVKKYGSEELQSWFANNGRHTLASYRHQMYGWAQDAKAAHNARMEDFDNVANSW